MDIKNRFFHPPDESFFLFGPRGTGKSTWLKRHFKNALTVDLLSAENFRMYSAKPERLKELIEGNPAAKTIIVDEIQKVPPLLDVVHQLIENKKGLRFILTGSSARKLKRSGVDLLAGRALLKTMHPFMAAELGGDFNLESAVKLGMLPLVLNSVNPEDVLKTYIALYLKEEVQMEGLVRNIGNFSRFLEAISFSHGSVLNTTQVASDCQIGRKAVEGYVEILEDLLLGFRVPVFMKRAKRHLSQHPKFYYFDTGVFNSIRPQGPLDTPEQMAGAALEGLIAQHLRAFNAHSFHQQALYFWRTKSGLEVDFIVYGARIFWALEVKNAKNIRSQDLKGLAAFREDYPEAELFFIYRGKERLKMKGILCIPCEEFLKNLIPGKTGPAANDG